jgi:hypothetical protein
MKCPASRVVLETGTARRLRMDHIGIDLGSKDSHVGVRNAAGEIVGEWRWRTVRLCQSRN